MKTLPPGLQAHLDGGATTIALCWKVTRRDATVQGFTEHDRDLAFDGVTYHATTGFSASDLVQTLGLAADNLNALGALSSQTINEDDLARGAYDDADVEILAVNWQDPAERVVLAAGSLGEVKRSSHAFEAEIRGLAHRLAQRTGRTYQFYCDADLGDARCGVDLENAAYKGTGAVTDIAGLTLTVSGLDTFAAGWFAGGRLTFSSGANAGLEYDVRRHDKAPVVTLELWGEPAEPVAATDTFTITAGCDKAFATCQAKFDNVANFRGFPHIPGNDVVQSYPNRGEKRLDGGSLFK